MTQYAGKRPGKGADELCSTSLTGFSDKKAERLKKAGKIMRYRWFDSGEDKNDEMGIKKMRPVSEEVTPIKKPRFFSRAMITGMLLSTVALIYGLMRRDVPLIFLAAAFIINGLIPLTGFLSKGAGHFLANLLKGFSVALFFGAIALAFL